MPPNLLLTGRPGIGKTTVIQRTLALLPALRCSGFTTAEIRGRHGRLGFHATTLGGRQIVLAHVNRPGPPRVGAYGVDVAAFEREIVPALDARQADVDLFVVDEIGKMECLSAGFCAAVEALFQDVRPLLGTIARRGPGLIERVRHRPDVEWIEVTTANRTRLPAELARRLQEMAGPSGRPFPAPPTGGKMNIVDIPGKDRGEVFLYALSTCVWCKKTKALLNDLGVAYRYVDVDLVPAEERETVLSQVARWNPQRNFPTLVIDNGRVIVGFRPEEIQEALGL